MIELALNAPQAPVADVEMEKPLNINNAILVYNSLKI